MNISQYQTKLFFFSIAFLIVAKLIPLFHIQFTNFYLDVDRTVALLFFLVLYYFRESISLRSMMFTLVGFASCLWIGTIFEIPVGRIITLFFLTALVEEILLRGVVIELLLKKITTHAALWLSAIIFALVHPGFYLFEAYSLILIAMGMSFAYLYFYLRKQGQPEAISLLTTFHTTLVLFYIS